MRARPSWSGNWLSRPRTWSGMSSGSLQAEMTRKGARAGRGAGLLGGSGILALYGIGCLLIAAVAGLALVLATWLAALIIAAAVLAVAGLAALMGRQQLGRATPPVPRQAIDSTKADVQEIREKAHR